MSRAKRSRLAGMLLGALLPSHVPAQEAGTLPGGFIIPCKRSVQTKLPGNGIDIAWGCAVDAAGNTYVTGETDSPNFPTTAGAWDPTYNGAQDAYVVKLSPQGRIVYATFLGTTDGDVGWNVAVDAANVAYVTGATSSAFPVTAGAFDTSYNGSGDGFLAKLSADGSTLLYGTFLGGADGGENLWGLAIDGAGSAYISGWTWSTDYPTTPEAFDRSFNGGTDAIVTKLSADGSTLVYSTYLGGAANEVGGTLALDADGNAYVTGGTASTNFPTTPGAFQESYVGGPEDNFVAKVSADGAMLVYSTYLGSTGQEYPRDIVVDTSGAAYVAGITISPTFPTTPSAYDTTYGGNQDGYVSKLSPDGAELQYSTFIGGVGEDLAGGIVLDAAGRLYMSGYTWSGDFPTTPLACQRVKNATMDAFVCELNAAGTALLYGTFLGGNYEERAVAIALDETGSIHIVGDVYYGGTAYDVFALRLP